MVADIGIAISMLNEIHSPRDESKTMKFETYRPRGKGFEFIGIRDAKDSQVAAKMAGYVHNLKVVATRPEDSRDKVLVYRFKSVPQLWHN